MKQCSYIFLMMVMVQLEIHKHKRGEVSITSDSSLENGRLVKCYMTILPTWQDLKLHRRQTLKVFPDRDSQSGKIYPFCRQWGSTGNGPRLNEKERAS